MISKRQLSSGLLAGILCLAIPGLAMAHQPISTTSPAIGMGTVYRVIDGDTFVVNLHSPGLFDRFASDAKGNDRRERHTNSRFNSIRVRLANVDTPESVHSNAAMNTPEGARISREVKARLEGKDVRVLCHDWGRYGRSICNVQLNGVASGDVGLWLIQSGYSPYVTRWGRNPYLHTEYTQAINEHLPAHSPARP